MQGRRPRTPASFRRRKEVKGNIALYSVEKIKVCDLIEDFCKIVEFLKNLSLSISEKQILLFDSFWLKRNQGVWGAASPSNIIFSQMKSHNNKQERGLTV